MSILNKILNQYGYIRVEGFEDAIIGVSSRDNIVYSIDKCIEILVKLGVDRADAVDYFYEHIDSMYYGKDAPIFIQTL